MAALRLAPVALHILASCRAFHVPSAPRDAVVTRVRRAAAPLDAPPPEPALARPLDAAAPPLSNIVKWAPAPARRFWAANWARVAILGCALTYGTNFAAVKTLDHELPPSLSASLRFGLSAAGAAVVLWDVRDWDWGSGDMRDLARVSVEVGAANALGYVSQSVGLEDVDASLSAFVCSLAVVVVPVLDATLDRRPTPARTWQAAALAVVGVALFSAPALAPGGGPAAVKGLLATLAQPVCFGFGFWRTEKALRRLPADADLTKASLACGAIQLLTVKVVADLWLAGDLWGNSGVALPDVAWLLHEPPAVAGAVVWTGVVTTLGTVLVETVALSEISAQESTVLFSTEPLWGAGFAAATLGERMDESCLVGGALIVVACLLASGSLEGTTGESAEA